MTASSSRSAFLLDKILAYDPRRAGPTVWSAHWIRHAYNGLAGSVYDGLPLSASALSRLLTFQRALYDGQTEPRTMDDLLQLARRALKRGVGRDQIESFMRLQQAVTMLSACDPDEVARRLPVSGTQDVAPPLYVDDDELLEIINRDTVRAVLSHLTPKQQARLADVVGLGERPPELHKQIAERLGISRSGVSTLVRDARRRVRNSGAAAELGATTVDQAQRQRRPKTCRRKNRSTRQRHGRGDG